MSQATQQTFGNSSSGLEKELSNNVAKVAGLEPGAWTKLTLPASVEKGASEPELRLVSATTEPGEKIVEFRGAVKIKAGKTVKVGEELFTVPAAFEPSAERSSKAAAKASINVPTTGKVTSAVELKEAEEASLVGLVYKL